MYTPFFDFRWDCLFLCMGGLINYYCFFLIYITFRLNHDLFQQAGITMHPFTIIEQIERTEYIKLRLNKYFRHPIVIIIYLLLAFNLMQIAFDLFDARENVNYILLLIFIFCALLPLIIRTIAIKEYYNSLYNNPITYTFDENSLYVYYVNKERQYNWNNILRAKIYRQYILIYLNKSGYFIIQKDRFTNQQLRWLLSICNSGKKTLLPIPKKLKNRSLAIMIILTLFILYFIYGGYRAHKIASQISVSLDAPTNYSNLFKAEYKKDLKVMVSFNNKMKNTVSIFTLGDNYKIIVYKIGKVSSNSLMTLIKEYNGHPKVRKNYINDNEHYYGIPGPKDYNISCAYDSLNTRLTTIYATFEGDSLSTTIKNDSVICYYLMLNDFSISYKENGKVDILSECKKGNDIHPFNVLFLKKENDIYLLLMSPEIKGTILKHDEIYSLLNQ